MILPPTTFSFPPSIFVMNEKKQPKKIFLEVHEIHELDEEEVKGS